MKLLVVKLADLGDVLTVTPALRALRQGLPTAHITAMVTPKTHPVVEGSPLVDQVLTFDKFIYDVPIQSLRRMALRTGWHLLEQLRREGYQALALMHHLTTCWGTVKYALLTCATKARIRAGLDNGHGWFLTQRVADKGFGGQHEVAYWLEVAKLLGGRIDDPLMTIPLSPGDETAAERCLSGIARRPLVALHPGSGGYSRARRWPLSGFQVVANALSADYKAQVVLVGGPEEQELAQQIVAGLREPPVNLVGQTTLRQLGAILQRCDLFVGNDNGLMHLAAAVGTPVVAIFGPSNADAWGPWYGCWRPKPLEGTKDIRLVPDLTGSIKGAVVQHPLPCSPCLYTGRRLGNRFGCQELTCLQSLSPHSVLLAARTLLEFHHGAR